MKLRLFLIAVFGVLGLFITAQHQQIIDGIPDQMGGKENATLRVNGDDSPLLFINSRVGIYAHSYQQSCDGFGCEHLGIAGIFEGGSRGIMGEAIGPFGIGVDGKGLLVGIQGRSDSGIGVLASGGSGTGLSANGSSRAISAISNSGIAIQASASATQPAFSGVGQFQVGNNTSTTGDYAIAMGIEAHASGDASVAVGGYVNTNGRSGAMILGDNDPNDEGETRSGADDQLVARFYNGYWFMTSGDNARTGMQAAHGANAWSSICDENRKENFQVLDDITMLSKLSSVNFSTWNYKGQDPDRFRHYGIMAQDFYRLFGQDDFGTIGVDTLVNPIDMLGVAMSAIKGAKLEIENTNSKMDRLKQEVSTLKESNEGLIEEIRRLQSQLTIVFNLITKIAPRDVSVSQSIINVNSE